MLQFTRFSVILATFFLVASHVVQGLQSRPFKIEAVNPVKTTTTTIATTTTTLPSTTTPLPTTTSSSTTPVLSTTTAVSSTTPSMASSKPDNVTNSSAIESKSPYDISYSLESGYQCACDLRQKLCDINCCCDTDCTQEMLKAFICIDQNLFHGFGYQQGLPSCKVNDGWLCIFKDNSKNVIHEVYDEHTQINRFHNWPNYFSIADQIASDRDVYVMGDLVMIYDTTTKEMKTIDLPHSLLNSHCHVVEPMRHLMSIHQNCTMPSNEFENFYLSLLENIESYKLIRNPKGIINADEHLIDPSLYGDLNVFICEMDTSQKSCVKINNATEVPTEQCWKLNFYVYHNFTYLQSMNISLVCSDTRRNPIVLTKHINVRFLQPNETLPDEPTISGKYGYRIGNPIIVGQYIPLNDNIDESEKVFTISYFHDNATIRSMHNGILLPKSIQGYCSDHKREQVGFFENTLTQCFIKCNNNSVLTADSNFTQLCENLQQNAFHYLVADEHFTGDFNMHISELGWPLNLTSHWIGAELRNFEPSQISGSYSPDTNSFQCTNMLLSIRYEFITARVSFRGMHHQNVIKKFAIDFGNRVNLRFKLHEDLTLPIYVYVRFFDATTSNSNQQINYGQFISNSFLIVSLRLFTIKF